MSRDGRRCPAILATALWLAAGAVTPSAAGEGPWVAPPEAKGIKNPIAKAEGARAGRRSYQINCAPCHGPAGQGDGPAAAALTPRPRNLTEPATQDQTDGELFWKITTGRAPMPTWRHLSERERWSLVHYIRSLAPRR